MKDNNTFVGIDVAKNHLDVCILPLNKTKRFKNNIAGIEDLINFIGNYNLVEKIILEPTGGYEELVLETLAERQFRVCMVNAAQIRAFARAGGILAKTDKIDAKVLADYGSKMPCRIYTPLPENVKQLKKLVSRRHQLVHMIVEEKNRLNKENNMDMLTFIKDSLNYLNNQKVLIEQKLLKIVNENTLLKNLKQVMTSLKGVGDLTAIVLMVELPELGKLTKNQISKLIGVAPLNRESGLMRGQSKIYGGRGLVRNILYFGALSAIRTEPVLRGFYLRLKNNGKPGKLAVIAVVHKMIVILNARVRDFYA